MTDDVDKSRRHFLGVATGVTAGVGAVLGLAPFVISMKPSARAQALGAPVEIDISPLEPGEMIRVEWRGKPVWVLRRTPDMLDTLGQVEGELQDPSSEDSVQPDYAGNQHRALKADIFVVIGQCTHLGCAPTERFEIGPADLGSDWLGGFFCPCHGSKFDLAGRVYKGVPAPLNLPVPPYRFTNDNTILIGSDTGAA